MIAEQLCFFGPEKMICGNGEGVGLMRRRLICYRACLVLGTEYFVETQLEGCRRVEIEKVRSGRDSKDQWKKLVYLDRKVTNLERSKRKRKE